MPVHASPAKAGRAKTRVPVVSGVSPGAHVDALPPAALTEIAAHFQVLAEPTRLHLLRLLREGERNVGDLAGLVGTSAANASRQLNMLCQHGLLEREARGAAVYYRVADPSVYELCELVCNQIARRLDALAQRREAFR